MKIFFGIVILLILLLASYFFMIKVSSGLGNEMGNNKEHIMKDGEVMEGAPMEDSM
jgi:regulatory protein YycI of two-component signal transduction system YycFG